MKKLKIGGLLIAITLSFFSEAQNLVPNGSFESVTSSPDGPHQFVSKVNDWTSLVNGTADLMINNNNFPNHHGYWYNSFAVGTVMDTPPNGGQYMGGLIHVSSGGAVENMFVELDEHDESICPVKISFYCAFERQEVDPQTIEVLISDGLISWPQSKGGANTTGHKQIFTFHPDQKRNGVWTKYETGWISTKFSHLMIRNMASKDYVFIDRVEVIAQPTSGKNISLIDDKTYNGVDSEFGCELVKAGLNADPTNGLYGPVVVSNLTDVVYESGSKIVLEAGFSATLGSKFRASIIPVCECIPNPVADAGFDMLLCPSQPSSIIGADCSGASYLWTSSPAGFTSWLSSTTACQPTVTPTSSASVLFTVAVSNGNGVTEYDDVWVNYASGNCTQYKVLEPNETNLQDVGFQALDIESQVGDLTTSVEQSEIENKTKRFIYPNPNNGQFNIELNTNGETVVVEVYDLVGKIVSSQNSGESLHKVNISDQPKGVYFVRVTIGDEVFNEKIVYQ